jgi:hypothetical protein
LATSLPNARSASFFALKSSYFKPKRNKSRGFSRSFGNGCKKRDANQRKLETKAFLLYLRRFMPLGLL